jgi:hypothetical protein
VYPFGRSFAVENEMGKKILVLTDKVRTLEKYSDTWVTADIDALLIELAKGGWDLLVLELSIFGGLGGLAIASSIWFNPHLPKQVLVVYSDRDERKDRKAGSTYHALRAFQSGRPGGRQIHLLRITGISFTELQEQIDCILG